MIPLLVSEKYGPLNFHNEFLKDWKGRRLPGAEVKTYQGSAGIIVMQEARHEHFLFRFFTFHLNSALRFHAPLDNGWQSFLTLKGEMNCEINGAAPVFMEEGKFLLFHSKGEKVKAEIAAGQTCELCAAVYYPGFYKDWKKLFPKLRLGQRLRQFFLPSPPIESSTGMVDAITDLFYEKMEPYLQATFNEMKVREALLLMLQQANHPLHGQKPKPWEEAAAAKARAIILKDITIHHTNVGIAAMLNMDRSVLTKAFRRVYKMGMHEFLIHTRFAKARELLLEGQSVKQVAAAVGYSSSYTFSSEFKKYYGYSPADLQNGNIK